MGLDSFELTLRVEDAFGIEIDDPPSIETVGQLHHVVVEKLGADRRDRCLTAVAFWRLRAALINVCGVDRQSIRPDTSLETVLPEDRRGKVWPHLADALGLRLPELRRAAVLSWFIACLIVVGFVIVRFTTDGLTTVLLWAAVILAGIAVVRLTRVFAVCVPRCITLGDLARVVLQDNYGKLAQDGGSNSDEAWVALVGIVADVLGVKADGINPETSFVRDLNVD